jgi:hypothetical protein
VDFAWEQEKLEATLREMLENGDEARLGLTPKQFGKCSLPRLGVQSDVTSFMRGKVLRRIAPAKEVLAANAILIQLFFFNP